MIVRDQDGTSGKLQAPRQYDTGVDAGAVDGTVEHVFVGDDLKGAVEEGDCEDFIGFVHELHLKIVADGRGAG